MKRHPALKGVAAGIFTAIAFTAFHHVLISDIWFAFIPMLVGGAACGASLAWTYDLLFQPASAWTWFIFTGLQTGLLLLLVLNVSALGLVEMSRDSVYIVGAFLGLLVAIMLGYALALLAMERNGLFRGADESVRVLVSKRAS
jgi:hypothetical protein